MEQEIHIEMNSESESPQQMVELQRPLLSSQPSHLSSNYSPQVEDKVSIDKIKKAFQDCRNGVLLPDTCIYKVPITIRHLNEKAYTPQLVSIGPFHYGNEKLQDMERHKLVLFKTFIQRAMSSLDDLFHFVKQLEPKIRASYSETLNLSELELVSLTLMDAGFIIQLFIMCHEGRELCTDAKLSQPWLLSSTVGDLILLENQLPFFIIEELFNKAFPKDHRGNLPSFLTLTYECFAYYNLQELEPTPNVKISHFTDLIRLFYFREKGSPQPSSKDILLYSANALQDAGINLKASYSKYLLDLNFSECDLEIPQFQVDDNTEPLFRNMIALEQCHYPNDAYITSYAIVLHCLIDTSKDADLLIKKNIVSNYLGDDNNNVALLCNGLCKNVMQSSLNSEYIKICQRLNSYCADPWHNMKASLRRDWRAGASVGGIILLLLTIAQTIFSVLQFVLKK